MTARYISYQNGIVTSVGDVPEDLTLSQWLVERNADMQLPANVLDDNLKIVGTLTYDSTINGYIYQDAP